jgi:hypothetical protein
MKKRWLFLLVPPAIVLFVFLFGEVVMHLWNWLLPGLFGWPMITFWQGLGLLVLSRILFGGFGGRSHHRGFRRGMTDRWERMTPEERDNFRKKFRGRSGSPEEPASEAEKTA